MKTITHIFTAIAFLMVSTSAVAQQPGKKEGYSAEKREKIESLKVGFLTEKMQLTTAEAEKFWPVYNKYKAEMKALRQYKRDTPEIGSMSDAEAAKFADAKIEQLEKELAVRKKYHAEFK